MRVCVGYEPTPEEARAIQMVKAALKVYFQETDGDPVPEGVDIHGMPEVFLAAMALMNLACNQGRTATSVTGQANVVMMLAMQAYSDERDESL